jgi:hypothetical protein
VAVPDWDKADLDHLPSGMKHSRWADDEKNEYGPAADGAKPQKIRRPRMTNSEKKSRAAQRSQADDKSTEDAQPAQAGNQSYQAQDQPTQVDHHSIQAGDQSTPGEDLSHLTANQRGKRPQNARPERTPENWENIRMERQAWAMRTARLVVNPQIAIDRQAEQQQQRLKREADYREAARLRAAAPTGPQQSPQAEDQYVQVANRRTRAAIQDAQAEEGDLSHLTHDQRKKRNREARANGTSTPEQLEAYRLNQEELRNRRANNPANPQKAIDRQKSNARAAERKANLEKADEAKTEPEEQGSRQEAGDRETRPSPATEENVSLSGGSQAQSNQTEGQSSLTEDGKKPGRKRNRADKSERDLWTPEERESFGRKQEVTAKAQAVNRERKEKTQAKNEKAAEDKVKQEEQRLKKEADDRDTARLRAAAPTGPRQPTLNYQTPLEAEYQERQRANLMYPQRHPRLPAANNQWQQSYPPAANNQQQNPHHAAGNNQRRESYPPAASDQQQHSRQTGPAGNNQQQRPHNPVANNQQQPDARGGRGGRGGRVGRGRGGNQRGGEGHGYEGYYDAEGNWREN